MKMEKKLFILIIGMIFIAGLVSAATEITDDTITTSGNITLGQKITFAFLEIFDNIYNGIIQITGALNVSGNFNVTGESYFKDIVTINGSGVLLNITNGTGESIFYVNSTTGNVGIRTTSPASILEIGDGLGDETVTISSGASSGDVGAIDFREGVNSRMALGYIYGANADSRQIRIASGPALTTNIGLVVTQSQKVGMGGDFTPDAILDILNIGAGDSFRVDDSSDGDSTPFLIDADGNVGFGTAIPGTNLEVEDYYATTYGSISWTANPESGADQLLIDNAGDSPTYTGIMFRNNRASGGWDVGRMGLVRMGDKAGDFVFILRDGADNFLERMRINSAGNVGIGNTTPAYKLHVEGDINATGAIYSGGDAVLTSYTESDPFWNSNWTAFNISVWSNTTNLSYVPYTGAINNLDLGANNFSVDASVFYVDSNLDRVGVGLSGQLPAYKFSVYEDTSALVALFNGSHALGAYIDVLMFNNPSAEAGIRFGSLDAQKWTLGYDNLDSTFKISRGPSLGQNTVLTILGAGAGIQNVGIGTTDPASKLTINASGGTSATSSLNVTNSTGGPLFLVRDDGKVGIGIANPSHPLHVYRSFGESPYIWIQQGGGAIVTIGAQAGRGLVGAASNHSFAFITNNTAKMTIDTSGRVGINTTTPTHTLNVVGDANITGNITANLFNGTFNWTEDSPYLSFDGSTLSLSQAVLNGTIAIYNASMKTYVDAQGEADWLSNWTAFNLSVWANTTNLSYYLASNPSSYLTSFTELDPHLTTNLSAYNNSWLNTTNLSYVSVDIVHGFGYYNSTTPQTELDPHLTTNLSAYNNSWLNTTNLSYYLDSNPDSFISSFTELDPHLTTNLSAYNNSWLNTTNLSYVSVDIVHGFGYYNSTTPQTELDPYWSANLTAYNDSWLNTTNLSYYLDSNPDSFISSFTELDPHLTTNLSAYNNTWKNMTNVSYYLVTNPFGYYNVTNKQPELDPHWTTNVTAYNTTWKGAINTSYYTIQNIQGYYNATDFDIADYATRTVIQGWGFYNSTAFSISDYATRTVIHGWGFYNSTTFDINDYMTEANTTLIGNYSSNTDFCIAGGACISGLIGGIRWDTNYTAKTGTGNVVYHTSPTFATGITVPANSISDDELDEGATFAWTSDHSFTENISTEGIILEGDASNHRIFDNATCVLIRGDTSTIHVC